MTDLADFDLRNFMPYLLNQAADATSREFETLYKSRYGMLRTEWRVLFHLGRYGAMSAKTICNRARLHKTKVSRAVQALDDKRYLTRAQHPSDRRREILTLTRAGDTVYANLSAEAQRFDAAMMAEFSDAESAQIRQFLSRLAKLE
ncbi:MarR family transcriptional regulator [Jannaschia sp.]|nr:MarR family transcriptional regulator [Jannaschia sp.]